ncbi:zincin-like metallopeptidase domain-containing protein [Stenotrophomonas maltophilia]
MTSDYARDVSESLIEQLQRGVAPWQRPWQAGERFRPYNPTSGNDYRGINSVYLMSRGFTDPRWMTYNQAKAEGAQVRRGQKGTRIEYWKYHGLEPVRDENTGEYVRNADGSIQQQKVEYTRPRVFHAVVFNAQQIDGLPPPQPRPVAPEMERHAAAEAILRTSGAKILHGGDRAFYSPSRDAITLPNLEQFRDAGSYYATALHELGHWTGHPNRLGRDLTHPFGSEGYAREELRAEIASLMMGDTLGIGHDPSRHAAYVGSWIKALREDPREIFRAAAEAEKIHGYVFELQQERIRFLTEEREYNMATLLHLRNEALQAQHDAAAMMDMARADPGADEAYIAQQQALATSWQDTAQANLNNAVANAPQDLREQWGELTASEQETSQEFTAFQDRAFDVEVSGDEERSQLRSAASAAQQQWQDALTRLEILRKELGVAAEQVQPVSFEDRVRADQRARFALNAHNGQMAIGQAPKDALKAIDYAAQEQGLRSFVRFTPLSDWSTVEPNQPTYSVDYLDADGRLQNKSVVLDRKGRAAISSGSSVPVPGEIGWTRSALELEQEVDAVAAQAANDKAMAKLVHDVVAAQQPAAPHDEKKETVVVESIVTPERTAEPDRVYLAIPFADKDEAKSLAAAEGIYLQWDKDAKSWSAPGDVDLSKFEKWRIHNQTPVLVSQASAGGSLLEAEQEFTDALNQMGFAMTERATLDGKWHRVRIDGDRGSERSGAYKGHYGGARPPAGHYHNHRTGEKGTWFSQSVSNALTPEERALQNASAAEQRQRRAREEARAYEQASTTAERIYALSEPATAVQTYCAKKGIDVPAGLRVVPAPSEATAGLNIGVTLKEMKQFKDNSPDEPAFMVGDLLVPAMDLEGKLWSVQRIGEGGFKAFMKTGRKAGLHTMAGSDLPFAQGPLGQDPTIPLIITEGYATGDAVSKIVGHPVVVAYDAGNMLNVAKQLRERFPDRPIIIAGDNDHTKEGTIGPNGRPLENVGRISALATAKAVDGIAMLPRFTKDDPGTDWNDKLMTPGVTLQLLQREWRAQLGAVRAQGQAAEVEAQSRASHQEQVAAQNRGDQQDSGQMASAGAELAPAMPRWLVRQHWAEMGEVSIPARKETVLVTDNPALAVAASNGLRGRDVVDITTGRIVLEQRAGSDPFKPFTDIQPELQKALAEQQERLQLEGGTPRWRVEAERGLMDQARDTVLETNSALEAIAAYKAANNRRIHDVQTGEVAVLYRDWGDRDDYSRELSAAAAAEQLKQGTLPDQPMPQQEVERARWRVEAPVAYMSRTMETLLETNSAKDALAVFKAGTDRVIRDAKSREPAAIYRDWGDSDGYSKELLAAIAAEDQQVAQPLAATRVPGQVIETRWVVRNASAGSQSNILETDSAVAAAGALSARGSGTVVYERRDGTLTSQSEAVIQRAAEAEKSLNAVLERARATDGRDQSNAKAAQGQSQSEEQEKVGRKRRSGR